MRSRTGYVSAGVVVVLAVVLAGVIGCAKAKEPGRYYSDKSFSIRFPDGWELKEGFMGVVVAAMSPPEAPGDKIGGNVMVKMENIPPGTTLADYVTVSLSNMKKMLTDFEVVEPVDATLGGVAAKGFVYRFRVGEVKLEALVYFLVKSDQGYGLTFGASPENFEKYRPQFEQIAKT